MLQRRLRKQTAAVHTRKWLLAHVSADVPSEVLCVVEAVRTLAASVHSAKGTVTALLAVRQDEVEVESLLGLAAQWALHHVRRRR